MVRSHCGNGFPAIGRATWSRPDGSLSLARSYRSASEVDVTGLAG